MKTIREEQELTFEQREEINKYLEGYKNNPSNSNKFRIGLHAYIEEILNERIDLILNIVVERIDKLKLPPVYFEEMLNPAAPDIETWNGNKIKSYNQALNAVYVPNDELNNKVAQGYNQALKDVKDLLMEGRRI